MPTSLKSISGPKMSCCTLVRISKVQFYIIECDLYSLFNNQEIQLIEETIAAVKNNKINDIIVERRQDLQSYTIFGNRLVSDFSKRYPICLH